MTRTMLAIALAAGWLMANGCSSTPPAPPTENPTTLADLRRKAERLEHEWKFAEAAVVFEEARRRFPGNADLLNNYAWMLCTAKDEPFRRANSGKAVAVATEALAASPRSAQIMDTLAEAYFVNRDFRSATESIRKAIALTPGDPYLYRQLEKFSRKWLEGLTTSAKPEERKDACAGLALALYRNLPENETAEAARQRQEEAKGLFTRVVEIAPDDTDALTYLGRIAYDRKEYATTIDMLEKVAGRRRDLPVVHFLLGNAYDKIGGRSADALLHYRRVRELAPDFRNIGFLIGQALFNLKEYDEALAELSLAAARFQQSGDLYVRLQTERHWEPILRLMGECHDAKGNDEAAMDCYAQALIMRGDDASCEEKLLRLFEKHPQEGETVRSHYARKLGIATNDFTDATDAAGLTGAKGNRVAIADYDNDGLPDILLAGPTLWKNQGNARFTDVTAEAGLGERGGFGIWADVNNDGLLDLFLASDSDDVTRGDCLYLQVSKGKFVPAKEAPIADTFPTPGCAWGDFDGDGLVDLYVANHEKGGMSKGTPDILWKNRGNGKFVDATKESGIADDPPLPGYGVNCGDFDNDGDLDIFVSNYRLTPNYLWLNDGKGRFTNVAEAKGVAGVKVGNMWGHTIGSVWGDFDNDGDLDLFCANLAHPRFIEFSNKSFLHVNGGPPDFAFTDTRERAGIRYEETHALPSWADYDNDGDLDLYITCCYGSCKSYLYRNNGDKTFTDVTWLAGVRVDNGWGNAWGDLDNDGDLDLIACGGTGPRIFLNNGNRNSWLQVNLVGRDCNRAAIGARVTVRTEDGALTQIREVDGGHASGSQDALTLAYGFSSYKGKVKIVVRWPCGRQEERSSEVNRVIVIEEKNE